MIDELARKAGPICWQSARVLAVASVARRIKSFVFSLSRPFRFLPGQHVDVRLTAPDGYRAMRSYSIASHPGDADRIELAIDLLENGEVSPFFYDVIDVGDEIELRGPLGGHFIWSDLGSGPALLIGGGSGVVPLVSMVRHRRASGSRTPVLLLVSARTWEDVPYREELLDLHERRDGFELVLTLTREPPRRLMDHGRRIDPRMVAEALALLPVPPSEIFVCGANPFVNAATEGLLDAGLPASTIRTERYGT